MRTIKFRGQTINGRWVYGLLCKPKTGQYKNKVFISNKAGCPMAYEVNPETVEQFTGTKDKNGVEIYTGDVVVFNNKKYVIKWNQLHCCYGLFYLQGGMHETITADWITKKGKVPEQWEITSFEVMGNIYENSELIK